MQIRRHTVISVLTAAICRIRRGLICRSIQRHEVDFILNDTTAIEVKSKTTISAKAAADLGIKITEI